MENFEIWQPKRTLSGEFTGKDLNHDNVIDRSEVHRVRVIDASGNRSFGPCCDQRGGGFSDSSWLKSFSYNLRDSSLQFSAYSGYSDDVFARGYNITTGESAIEYVQLDRIGVIWSPETTLKVTSIVPEPASYAMMGLGLLFLGTLQRRRKYGK